jgi:hypothetical protein
MFKKIILSFIALCGTICLSSIGNAAAPYTRSQLTTNYLNPCIFNNALGQISAQCVYTLQANGIASFGNLADTNTWTGANNFGFGDLTASNPTFQNGVNITNPSNPFLYLDNTSLNGGQNLGAWNQRVDNTTGTLEFQAMNDAGSATNTWLSVTRSGYTPILATFGVPIVGTGSLYNITPQYGIPYAGGAGAGPGITTPVANSVPCRAASNTAPTECTTLPSGLTIPQATFSGGSTTTPALNISPTTGLNYGLFETQAISGTQTGVGGICTAAFGCPYNGIETTSDNANLGSTNTGVSFWVADFYGGSSLSGYRTAFQVTMEQQATNPNNTAALRSYAAQQIFNYSATGDGGTNGSPLGFYYGLTSTTFLDNPVSGSLYITENDGIEIDTASASNVHAKYGIGLNVVNVEKNQGSSFDAAVAIGAQTVQGTAGSGAGWQCGICWTDVNTASPVGSASTLIGYYWSSLSTQTVTNGIDLRGFAFSGYALVGSNFFISGFGNVGTPELDAYSTNLVINVGTGGNGALEVAGAATAYWNSAGIYPKTNDSGAQLGANGAAWSLVNAHSFAVDASTGVTCSGSPTASFASTAGIVTHC